MDEPGATVNGMEAPLSGVPVHTTALDWLRGRGLVGAKEGCAEGECGACSVLVARPGVGSPTRWTALNACLLPALALDGQEVVTAEGLGATEELHPVQREMAVRGGSQCGYCTPGFVCSMAAEFYRPDRSASTAAPAEGCPADPLRGPNGFDLHALSGNLCRCTGYRPIRDAAYALGQPDDEDFLAARSTQPPPAIPRTRQRDDVGEFLRPADLAEALAVLAEDPAAVLVAGSTDWGVEVNLRAARAGLLIAVDRLPELRTFSVGADRVELGAALTLSELEQLLEGRAPLLDLLFPQFASRLIRNGATLGGNLGTGSPIGDAAPVLLALDATLVLASADGDREVPLAEYFTGYRTSVRRPGELIRAVRFPTRQPELVSFTKIAKRRFDDISSVAVAIGLDFADGIVQRARIGLGGVAATPVRARATEDVLTGRSWTTGAVHAAAEVLAGEGTPLDDHRASSAYRQAMLRQALLKFAAQHRVPQEVGA